jgi:hypothetical protein
MYRKLAPKLLGTWTAESWNYTTDYLWVVVCKSHRFHTKGTLGTGHKILLGESDAYAALGMLPETINACCGSCGEEYTYKLKEIMGHEVPVLEAFVLHPLFKFV